MPDLHVACFLHPSPMQTNTVVGINGGCVVGKMANGSSHAKLMVSSNKLYVHLCPRKLLISLRYLMHLLLMMMMVVVVREGARARGGGFREGFARAESTVYRS